MKNNRVKIDVPQSWKDILLGDYEKWNIEKTTDYSKLVDYVCLICKIDRKEIETYPIEVFSEIVSIVDFAFYPDFEMRDGLIWDGVEYKINRYEKMSLAEYVDIDAVLKADNKTYISDTLAIILRPEDEKYNLEKAEERAALFRTIPCSEILPVVAFFLSNTANLDNALALYSLTADRVNLFLQNIESSVQNGDGIKRFAIYQKIRLTKSIKHLREILRTSSVSYCIN